MNKLKSILATKIPAWDFMGEEEQNIVAFEIWSAVNTQGIYQVGSFEITADDLNVTLNGEIMAAEVALTEISTRLVYTYRDLIELKMLPASVNRDTQIVLLESHVVDFENQMNRIGVLLKYDTDLVAAMVAQCEHNADRLVVA